jgi:hypothetical protein
MVYINTAETPRKPKMHSLIWVVFLVGLFITETNAEESCNLQIGGFYLDSSSQACLPCNPGYGCPPGISITSDTVNAYKCSAGTYQPAQGQTSCIPCPQNTACPLAGAINFVMCDLGDSAPIGSSACRSCTNPDYFRNSSGFCNLRTKCKHGIQYESSRPIGSDTICNSLTAYTPILKTASDGISSPTCVVGGKLLCTGVLQSYIKVLETATSDRQIETWTPCPVGNYIAQRVVADASGFMVKPQICKQYTNCYSSGMYMIVDGSKTEDQVSRFFLIL